MRAKMSHVPHGLHEEFPSDHARIHELKKSDKHFVGLTERYHELNRSIHRVEAEIEHTSDDVLEDMKKQRLALKDEIAAIIAT